MNIKSGFLKHLNALNMTLHQVKNKFSHENGQQLSPNLRSSLYETLYKLEAYLSIYQPNYFHYIFTENEGQTATRKTLSV